MSQEPDLPPIDRAYLGELTSGDIEFLCELLDTFVESVPPLLANLVAAVADGDAPKASYYAHTLKGSSKSIGAHQAADSLADMESACRATDQNQMASLIEEVKQHVDEAVTCAQTISAAKGV